MVPATGSQSVSDADWSSQVRARVTQLVTKLSPDALPALHQRQQWFLLPALAFVCLGLLIPARGRKS